MKLAPGDRFEAVFDVAVPVEAERLLYRIPLTPVEYACVPLTPALLAELRTDGLVALKLLCLTGRFGADEDSLTPGRVPLPTDTAPGHVHRVALRVAQQFTGLGWI